MLRTVGGNIAERWFYERLVNMTYSPKNKVGDEMHTEVRNLKPALKGFVFVATKRGPNSATQILHEQVSRPVLLHQGGHGEGRQQGRGRGGRSRHGARGRVPCPGRPERRGRPAPGLHGGRGTPLRQLQGRPEQYCWRLRNIVNH